MVSNASEDFPEPLTPVTTVIWFMGIENEMFLRLLTRSPCTSIASWVMLIPMRLFQKPARKQGRLTRELPSLTVRLLTPHRYESVPPRKPHMLSLWWAAVRLGKDTEIQRGRWQQRPAFGHLKRLLRQRWLL